MRRSTTLLSSFHVYSLLIVMEFLQLTPDVWILYRLLVAYSLSRMLCSKLLVGFGMQCFLWNHMYQILPLRIFPPMLKFHLHHSDQGTILLLLVITHLLATLMVWSTLGIPPKPYEQLASFLHDLDCNVFSDRAPHFYGYERQGHVPFFDRPPSPGRWGPQVCGGSFQ